MSDRLSRVARARIGCRSRATLSHRPMSGVRALGRPNLPDALALTWDLLVGEVLLSKRDGRAARAGSRPLLAGQGRRDFRPGIAAGMPGSGLRSRQRYFCLESKRGLGFARPRRSWPCDDTLIANSASGALFVPGRENGTLALQPSVRTATWTPYQNRAAWSPYLRCGRLFVRSTECTWCAPFDGEVIGRSPRI